MSKPRYKALLIGNGTFETDPHALQALKGPPNDLKILRAAITHAETGVFDPADVRELLDGTHTAVLRAIHEFFTAASIGDHLLFYYSGHGIRDVFGNFFLCARDTSTEALAITGIPDSTINLLAKNSRAQKYFFVLDCCHSGAFKGGSDLAQLSEGGGRCLIASCASAALSEDAKTSSGASVFTHYLAEALTSDQVDGDHDGVVHTDEVLKFLRARVREASKQTVQCTMEKAFGDTALARSRRRGEARPAPPEPPPLSPESVRPAIELSESSLEFRDVHAGEQLPVERIDVHNVGGGRLDWLCETEEAWIKAERQGDRLVVTLDTAKSGRHRGKITVRDRSGLAAPKVVRVFLHVAEPVAPPPLRPEPPIVPPPPPAVNHDAAFVQALQGWWMNDAGAIRIRLEGGALVLHDFNLVGMQVGQGTIHVQNNTATVQGMSTVAGPYTGQFGIQGNMLNASLMFSGQMAHATFMRQSPWFAAFAG